MNNPLGLLLAMALMSQSDENKAVSQLERIIKRRVY